MFLIWLIVFSVFVYVLILCRLVLLISSSQSRKEDREQREKIIIIINKYRESVYTVQYPW